MPARRVQLRGEKKRIIELHDKSWRLSKIRPTLFYLAVRSTLERYNLDTCFTIIGTLNRVFFIPQSKQFVN